MPHELIEINPIEQRFDELMRSWGFPTFGWPFRSTLPTAERPFAPPSEVMVDEKAFTVRTDLPGVDPARDVTVLVEEGELVIRGERKQKTETKEKGYHRSELYTGYFERHFALPKGAAVDKIAATYGDGVLEVSVPITAAAPKATPIKIEAKAAK